MLGSNQRPLPCEGILQDVFSSLVMERGTKRCGHIIEAERRQKDRRHVPQNALVFGGTREHPVFPGRSGNLVQHRPNPPNRRTVSKVYGEYFETLPAAAR
jgi:hypothetical protein